MLEVGSPSERLLEESQHADTLVLGSRGTGGFADLVIGSTTMHVTAHAACPVIAVPSPPAPDVVRHGVVVGVDGSEAAEAAIGFAFEIASDVGESVTAIHAWHDPTRTGVGTMMLGSPTTRKRSPKQSAWHLRSRWPAGRRSSRTSRSKRRSCLDTRSPGSCRARHERPDPRSRLPRSGSLEQPCPDRSATGSCTTRPGRWPSFIVASSRCGLSAFTQARGAPFIRAQSAVHSGAERRTSVGESQAALSTTGNAAR